MLTWPSQRATSQRQEDQPAVRPGPETITIQSLHLLSLYLSNLSPWSSWRRCHSRRQRSHRGPLPFRKPPAWPPRPGCRWCWVNNFVIVLIYRHFRHPHIQNLHQGHNFNPTDVKVKSVGLERYFVMFVSMFNVHQDWPSDRKVEPVSPKDPKDDRQNEGIQLLPPWNWLLMNVSYFSLI